MQKSPGCQEVPPSPVANSLVTLVYYQNVIKSPNLAYIYTYSVYTHSIVLLALVEGFCLKSKGFNGPTTEAVHIRAPKTLLRHWRASLISTV